MNIGDTFNNCIKNSGEYNAVTYSDYDCAENAVLVNPEPIVYLDRYTDNGYDFVGGDTIDWNIDFYSLPQNNANLSGIVLMELLPPGTSLVPGSISHADDGDWTAAGNPAPLFEEILNYDGLGSTLLRWTFDASLGNDWTLVPVLGNGWVFIQTIGWLSMKTLHLALLMLLRWCL